MAKDSVPSTSRNMNLNQDIGIVESNERRGSINSKNTMRTLMEVPSGTSATSPGLKMAKHSALSTRRNMNLNQDIGIIKTKERNGSINSKNTMRTLMKVPSGTSATSPGVKMAKHSVLSTRRNMNLNQDIGIIKTEERNGSIYSKKTMRTSATPPGHNSVGAVVLNAARASEDANTYINTYHDFDNELSILDPNELDNEEIKFWISLTAKNNKTIEAEAWMLEKFWVRIRHATTPSRDAPDNFPRAPLSKSSLQLYEEIVRGSNQRQEATFKECQMGLQDDQASPNGPKKSAVSAGSGLGTRLFRAHGPSMMTKITTESTASSGPGSDEEVTLVTEQKIDIAILQVRRMKEENTERKERHEFTCLIKNSEIEQHKAHLKSTKYYRLLFSREHKRGNGMSGDAILKFYDDVIKHENHAKDIIRLSNINLKTKGKYVENNIRMREEGGDNFKLVDYQKLELMNDERQQVFSEESTVLANLKKTLGDCNFYSNRWRKRLDTVEEEGEKLRKEKAMRKSILAQVQNETKIVEAAIKELRREHEEIHSLTQNYVIPETVTYVREVATNHNLENEVRTWQRRIHLLQFSLQELSTTLKKLEKEAKGINVNANRAARASLRRGRFGRSGKTFRLDKVRIGKSATPMPSSLPPIER